MSTILWKGKSMECRFVPSNLVTTTNLNKSGDNRGATPNLYFT